MLRSISLFTILTILPPSLGKVGVFEIPDTLYNGTVQVDFNSSFSGLDGLKIQPGPNATTHDSWFFDAVSGSSRNESVYFLVQMANAASSFAGNTDPAYVQISGSFKNGSAFSYTSSATDGATVIDSGDAGIAVDFKGSGLRFTGTGLRGPAAVYTVSVDAPSIGIYGQLTLRSLAPAHFACGLDTPGMNELLVPHVGWSNALPDATATADFTVGGEPISFTGVGYHDKVWGDREFPGEIQSWYWGHAQLGPYSLVWYVTREYDDSRYNSGYVAKDGVPLLSSCANSTVEVKTYGNNTEYPPTPSFGPPDGMILRFDMGGEGILVANVTRQLSVGLQTNTGQFFIGSISGGIEGQENFDGKTMWQLLQFPL